MSDNDEDLCLCCMEPFLGDEEPGADMCSVCREEMEAQDAQDEAEFADSLADQSLYDDEDGFWDEE